LFRESHLTILLAARHKWAHPALTPAGEGWYLIYRTRRDGRLSWPRCLIMHGLGIARSEVWHPTAAPLRHLVYYMYYIPRMSKRLLTVWHAYTIVNLTGWYYLGSLRVFNGFSVARCRIFTRRKFSARSCTSATCTSCTTCMLSRRITWRPDWHWSYMPTCCRGLTTCCQRPPTGGGQHSVSGSGRRPSTTGSSANSTVARYVIATIYHKICHSHHLSQDHTQVHLWQGLLYLPSSTKSDIAIVQQWQGVS